MLRELFSKNLKARRLALKISQDALSERSGVSASSISYIEKGKERAGVTLPNLERLANGLGLPPWYLLLDTSKFNPSSAKNLIDFCNLYSSMKTENKEKAEAYIRDLKKLELLD